MLKKRLQMEKPFYGYLQVESILDKDKNYLFPHKWCEIIFVFHSSARSILKNPYLTVPWNI